ncbi:hypothetical protein M0805_002615 [Coniferiporia weirii]|nr:hypothetical protein M0805_002615 [Coniferiporia weirii]
MTISMTQSPVSGPYAIFKPTRHPEFSFDDDRVTFLVESTTFTVHKFLFTRNSGLFADLFSLPPAPGVPAEGASPEDPIVIQDTRSLDFERFLHVLYPQRMDHDDLHTADEWTSVLSIADKLQFPSIRHTALTRLTTLAPPTLKIALGHRFAVHTLLLTGYVELSIRATPLDSAEIRALAPEDVALIAAVREETEPLRKQLRSCIKRATAAERSGAPVIPSPTSIAVAVIKERFRAHMYGAVEDCDWPSCPEPGLLFSGNSGLVFD